MKGPLWSTWVADADGSNMREIVKGTGDSTISPDGRRLAYQIDSTLYVVDVAGGKRRRIGEVWWRLWAPDSKQLAVGTATGLFLVDVASGARRQVVRGDVSRWSAFSFAPDGSALAYVDVREGDPMGTDIYALRLSDGVTKRLTHDGGSDWPLWGPGWIVYRQFRSSADQASPHLGDLRLIRADGSGGRLFAPADEGSDDGLVPLEFSDDGRRLLSCNSVGVSCRPVTFTFPEGERHELSIGRDAAVFDARDFASNGSEVLIEVGPLDGPTDAYAIPFAGGPARLLVKDAHGPSWFPQSRDDID